MLPDQCGHSVFLVVCVNCKPRRQVPAGVRVCVPPAGSDPDNDRLRSSRHGSPPPAPGPAANSSPHGEDRYDIRPPLALLHQPRQHVGRLHVLVVLPRQAQKRQRLLAVHLHPITQLAVLLAPLVEPTRQVAPCRLRERFSQAGMIVAHHQCDALQAPLPQPFEKLPPTRQALAVGPSAMGVPPYSLFVVRRPRCECFLPLPFGRPPFLPFSRGRDCFQRSIRRSRLGHLRDRRVAQVVKAETLRPRRRKVELNRHRLEGCTSQSAGRDAGVDCNSLKTLVGGTGLEPVTSCL